jgi:hypothetical protein
MARMARTRARRPGTVRMAAGALGFVGVTGLAGGIEMILYPHGNQFVDGDWLAGIPLVDSYRLPGLVLAGVIGGGATAACLGLLRRPHVNLLVPVEQRTGQQWSWAATRLTGGALSAWLLTELLLIPDRSAVEAVYAAAALALLGLPALPSFRDYTALTGPVAG